MTPIKDLVDEVTGLCACHKSYSTRDRSDPQCCKCNCSGAIRSAIERALRERRTEAVGRVPEGWKLVPVEPTDDMVIAAISDWIANPTFVARRTYQAILAASPSAPLERK